MWSSKIIYILSLFMNYIKWKYRSLCLFICCCFVLFLLWLFFVSSLIVFCLFFVCLCGALRWPTWLMGYLHLVSVCCCCFLFFVCILYIIYFISFILFWSDQELFNLQKTNFNSQSPTWSGHWPFSSLASRPVAWPVR